MPQFLLLHVALVLCSLLAACWMVPSCLCSLPPTARRDDRRRRREWSVFRVSSRRQPPRQAPHVISIDGPAAAASPTPPVAVPRGRALIIRAYGRDSHPIGLGANEAGRKGSLENSCCFLRVIAELCVRALTRLFLSRSTKPNPRSPHRSLLWSSQKSPLARSATHKNSPPPAAPPRKMFALCWRFNLARRSSHKMLLLLLCCMLLVGSGSCSPTHDREGHGADRCPLRLLSS